MARCSPAASHRANLQSLPGRDLKTLARLLIAQNTQRLPAEIENGIVDSFSTVEITGARITLGGALPPAQRTRDWARMHLLVTDPAYSGTARVMISNLEQGSELNTAYKNAFERTGAQIEKQVDDYLAAGTFGTENISGRAINSTRDFHVQQWTATKHAGIGRRAAGGRFTRGRQRIPSSALPRASFPFGGTRGRPRSPGHSGC